MEPLYDLFAEVYAAGPYPHYTERMITAFAPLLEHYGAPYSGRLLDIACGEGTFAVAMAHAGWQVSGADQSARMLQFAQQKADQAVQSVQFFQRDMRALEFNGEFDVCTCWFDSLNYLLQLSDLKEAFTSAFRALKPGGWYCFDMNTIYGLSYTWQQMNTYIQQDSENLLEIHSTGYDCEKQIAVLQITAFVLVPEMELWKRIDEIHRERGYPLDQVQSLLEAAGFRVAALLGNAFEFTPPEPESSRAWFICQKAD